MRLNTWFAINHHNHNIFSCTLLKPLRLVVFTFENRDHKSSLPCMVQMISDIHPLILDGFILTDLSKSWFSLKITGVLLHFVESHQTGQFFFAVHLN